MEIIYLKSVDSTHTYLKEYIKKRGYFHPTLVWTQNQTAGIGSRDNQWRGYEGNLFFSFVIDKSFLPDDLPIQSYSLYFSFLLKELFSQRDSQVWLKWPNDFYNQDKKIGGTITGMSNQLVYCGIGLNLLETQKDFGILDIKIEPLELLKGYLGYIKQKKSWKQIFSKFLIEFEKSKSFKTTINGKKLSLANAVLQADGSIMLDNEKVFSLR